MGAATPHSNFLRGIKWSPDGACFLTAADDNWYGCCCTQEEKLFINRYRREGNCGILTAAGFCSGGLQAPGV